MEEQSCSSLLSWQRRSPSATSTWPPEPPTPGPKIACLHLSALLVSARSPETSRGTARPPTHTHTHTHTHTLTPVCLSVVSTRFSFGCSPSHLPPSASEHSCAGQTAAGDITAPAGKWSHLLRLWDTSPPRAPAPWPYPYYVWVAVVLSQNFALKLILKTGSMSKNWRHKTTVVWNPYFLSRGFQVPLVPLNLLLNHCETAPGSYHRSFCDSWKWQWWVVSLGTDSSRRWMTILIISVGLHHTQCWHSISGERSLDVVRRHGVWVLLSLGGSSIEKVWDYQIQLENWIVDYSTIFPSTGWRVWRVFLLNMDGKIIEHCCCTVLCVEGGGGPMWWRSWCSPHRLPRERTEQERQRDGGGEKREKMQVGGREREMRESLLLTHMNTCMSEPQWVPSPTTHTSMPWLNNRNGGDFSYWNERLHIHICIYAYIHGCLPYISLSLKRNKITYQLMVCSHLSEQNNPSWEEAPY